MWSFEETELYLAETAPPGTSVYGLGRINHLLELLGHPEKSMTCVTVVGTNGKGSVLAFMDSILRAHGLNVACHIKPHLECVTERIRLNGVDSSRETFADGMWHIKKVIDEGWNREDRPTYFELIFGAFLYLARKSCADVALLEAGLGGRLDAVNSVDSPLVVLTVVDYDHTELLGNSLESIADEKLAVVRPGATLVYLEGAPEVNSRIDKYAVDKGIRLVRVDTDRKRDVVGKLSDNGHDYPVTDLISLTGPYQEKNARLAHYAVKAFTGTATWFFPRGLDKNAITSGLAGARLPGRWEIFTAGEGSPVVILDGAHNAGALKVVLSEFRKSVPGDRSIIFGMKKSKDPGCIMDELLNSTDRIIFTTIPDVECHEPEYLYRLAKESTGCDNKSSQIQLYCLDSIVGAVDAAFRNTSPDGRILITGSLYLAGAARTILRKSCEPVAGLI